MEKKINNIKGNMNNWVYAMNVDDKMNFKEVVELIEKTVNESYGEKEKFYSEKIHAIKRFISMINSISSFLRNAKSLSQEIGKTPEKNKNNELIVDEISNFLGDCNIEVDEIEEILVNIRKYVERIRENYDQLVKQENINEANMRTGFEKDDEYNLYDYGTCVNDVNIPPF